MLLLLDTLAGLWLGGFLRRVRGFAPRAAVLALTVFALGAAVTARVRPRRKGLHRPAPARSSRRSPRARLRHHRGRGRRHREPRRAHRPDPDAGEPHRLEPGDPIGIDPGKDELAFYPLIYWPSSPGAPSPASRDPGIDAFMRNGGTVIFDTRDALTARPAARRPRKRPISARCSRPSKCRNSSRCRRPRAHEGVLPRGQFPRPLRHRPDRVETLPRRARAASAARRGPATASRPSSSRATTSPPPGRWASAARRSTPSVGGDQRQREMAFGAASTL